MLVVTVTFEAYPDRAEEFLARVRRQAGDSLTREPGCHRFDVCTDPERPGWVFLYEIYSDSAAFHSHLDSEYFKAFDAETVPMLRSKVVETWRIEG